MFVQADDRPQDNCGHLVLNTAALTVNPSLTALCVVYTVNTQKVPDDSHAFQGIQVHLRGLVIREP